MPVPGRVPEAAEGLKHCQLKTGQTDAGPAQCRPAECPHGFRRGAEGVDRGSARPSPAGARTKP